MALASDTKEHRINFSTLAKSVTALNKMKFLGRPSEKLLCMSCQNVASEPFKLVCCGGICCKVCLEFEKTCPKCQLTSAGTFDKTSDSTIKNLLVRCQNLSRGCPWVGCLSEHDAHVQRCPKETVPCTLHEIGCGATMLRDELPKHWLKSKDYHIECALEAVVKLKRSNGELRRTVQEMKTAQHQLEKQLQCCSPPPQAQPVVAVYKMTGFKKHKLKKLCWYSLPFYTHRGGYKMCLRVDAAGISSKSTKSNDEPYDPSLSLLVCLVQGENDGELFWPFRGKLTVELLNQSVDKHHHSAVVVFDSDKHETYNSRVNTSRSHSVSGRGWVQFVSHGLLQADGKNCQFLKDDALYFRVSNIEVMESNKPWLTCTQ